MKRVYRILDRSRRVEDTVEELGRGEFILPTLHYMNIEKGIRATLDRLTFRLMTRQTDNKIISCICSTDIVVIYLLSYFFPWPKIKAWAIRVMRNYSCKFQIANFLVYKFLDYFSLQIANFKFANWRIKNVLIQKRSGKPSKSSLKYMFKEYWK